MENKAALDFLMFLSQETQGKKFSGDPNVLSSPLPSPTVKMLALWKKSYDELAAAAKSLQSCLTLCDPTDGLLPGSSVPGILQAKTLEWVAISFSIESLRILHK